MAFLLFGSVLTASHRWLFLADRDVGKEVPPAAAQIFGIIVARTGTSTVEMQQE